MACNPSQQPIKFNVDDLHRAMDLKDNIRNTSVVGQLGHGSITSQVIFCYTYFIFVNFINYHSSFNVNINRKIHFD